MITGSFRKRRLWMTPQGAFHWINAICIVCLVLLGTIMMFREDLGFLSLESKLALKRVHSYIGYFFVVNLLLRGLAGIRTKPNSKPRIKPESLFQFLASFLRNKPTQPSITRSSSEIISLILFMLLSLSAASGLARAGTDLYLPPIGSMVATWLADQPELADQLDPLSEQHVNQTRLRKLNKVKIPLGLVHKWSAYTLLFVLLIHILLAFELSRRPTKTRSDRADPDSLENRGAIRQNSEDSQ